MLARAPDGKRGFRACILGSHADIAWNDACVAYIMYPERVCMCMCASSWRANGERVWNAKQGGECDDVHICMYDDMVHNSLYSCCVCSCWLRAENFTGAEPSMGSAVWKGTSAECRAKGPRQPRRTATLKNDKSKMYVCPTARLLGALCTETTLNITSRV